MKRFRTAALALAVAGCAAGPGPRGGEGFRPLSANPGEVIAAELAFARLAQDKGQWTAFRATSADDAVMFTPQMVLAQQWLKGRADPPVAVRWQPHQVWSSCDGSLAVTHGAWQRPSGTGYFTTIWRRTPDGGHKWIFDHGDALKEPLPAPEMVAAKVADCVRGPRGEPVPPAPFDPAHRTGRSDDGTLVWEVTAEPDGAHNLSVEMRIDGKMTPVTIEEVAAAGG